MKNNLKELTVVTKCETKLLPEDLLKHLNYDQSENEDDSDSDDQVYQFVADKNKFNIKENPGQFHKKHDDINRHAYTCNKDFSFPKNYLENPKQIINPHFTAIGPVPEFHNVRYSKKKVKMVSPQVRMKPFSHNNLIEKNSMNSYIDTSFSHLDRSIQHINPMYYHSNSGSNQFNHQNYYNLKNNLIHPQCLSNFGREDQYMNKIVVSSDNKIPTFNPFNNSKINLIFRFQRKFL
jgi:hypothetical protein